MAISSDDTRVAIKVMNAFLQGVNDESPENSAVLAQALNEAERKPLVFGLINLVHLLLFNAQNRTVQGETPERNLELTAEALRLRDEGKLPS